MHRVTVVTAEGKYSIDHSYFYDNQLEEFFVYMNGRRLPKKGPIVLNGELCEVRDHIKNMVIDIAGSDDRVSKVGA